ncbi:gram positive anchor [Streptococcus infantis SK970]|nr:gram positive anchor [Streptococcus infantis SK970]
MPNTGEQSKAGVVALGAALGLVGLGLVAKRKKKMKLNILLFVNCSGLKKS